MRLEAAASVTKTIRSGLERVEHRHSLLFTRSELNPIEDNCDLFRLLSVALCWPVVVEADNAQDDTVFRCVAEAQLIEHKTNHKLTSMCPADNPPVWVTVTINGTRPISAENSGSMPSSSFNSRDAASAGLSSGST